MLPLAVLSAIGAGLGGLAFFTFVGGAITVARFRGIGVSGTKSVALVPRADLLAVGAQALLTPCVVALFALACFVPIARDRPFRIAYLAFLAAAGFAALWAWTPYQPQWWGRHLDTFLLLVGIVGAGGIAVNRLTPSLPLPSRRPGVTLPTTGGRSLFEPPADPPLHARLAGAGPRLWNRARRSATAAGPSRAAAGALLFLVVALAGTVAQYGAARAKPQIHAMAVMRKGASPLCGVYVGESAKDIWIALPNPDKNLPYFVAAVPRETVTAVAIGKTAPKADAASQGQPLLTALATQLKAVTAKETKCPA
jgi:hypothetical protein